MRPSKTGFTLLELAVVMVIMVTFIGFALGGSSGFIGRQQVRLNTQDVISMIMTARDYARRSECDAELKLSNVNQTSGSDGPQRGDLSMLLEVRRQANAPCEIWFDSVGGGDSGVVSETRIVKGLTVELPQDTSNLPLNFEGGTGQFLPGLGNLTEITLSKADYSALLSLRAEGIVNVRYR